MSLNINGYNYAPFNTTQAGRVAVQSNPQQQEYQSSAPKDGVDDGKISFWEKIKNTGKGIVNTVTGAVNAIISDPKKLLLTAATAAACIVCPPLGVGLAVAGGVAGGVTIVKGISRASNAATDSEAELAWQQVGSGGLQVGLSVIGAKAGLKNCGNASAAWANKSASLPTRLMNTGKALVVDAKSAVARNLPKTTANVSKVWSDMGQVKGVANKFAAAKESISNIWQNSKFGQDPIGTIEQRLHKYKKSDYQATGAKTISKTEALNSKIDNLGLDQNLSNQLKNAVSAEKTSQVKAILDKIDDSVMSSTEKSALLKQIKNVKSQQTKLGKMQQKSIGDIQPNTTEKGLTIYDPKNVQNVTTPEGRLIKGMVEEGKVWAKKTIKSNADAARTDFNNAIGNQGASRISNAAAKELSKELSAEGVKVKNNLVEAQKNFNTIKQQAESITDPMQKAATLGKAEAALDMAKSELSTYTAKAAQYKALYGQETNLNNASVLANDTATKFQAAQAVSGYAIPAMKDEMYNFYSDI